jgi:hypothetical protein
VHLGARIDGLDLPTLAPPRFPLGLDYPTWSLLKQHEPDWLLPGSERLQKDSITALRTNPAFIDAYLLGINAQFLAEARWRGLPTDPWGTPLRMFFGPVDVITHERVREVYPISAWMESSMLGAREHQSTRATAADPSEAERLVIIFNSPLFRRYPKTLVYLHRAPPQVKDDELIAKPDLILRGVDDPEIQDLWFSDRVDIAPSFTGTLTPDLVFFGFDIPPNDLGEYWLMLDEPPAELRFRAAVPGNAIRGINDLAALHALPSSAAAADKLIDHPTRVAISGRHLLTEAGGNP